MEHDCKQEKWNVGDINSFARVAAENIWPVVITGGIDDVHKATSALEDKEAIAEGKHIISQLAALKHEVQHNRALIPLPEEAGSDIKTYNAELATLDSPTWHNGVWLYLDCYLFRRIACLFQVSKHWKKYDLFAIKKIESFTSSRAAVVELAIRYNAIIDQTSASSSSSVSLSEEDQRLLFKEMLDVSLWGNKTDLSLLAMSPGADVSLLQGAAARKKSEKNIVVNDSDQAFQILHSLSSSSIMTERRVDIILDNSGFEVFADLVLAAYLIHSNLATVIVFHPKSIPWFVSDVLPTDFATVLQALLNSDEFFSLNDSKHSEALKKLSADWMGLYQDGKFVLRPSICWTGAGSYWRLPFEYPSVVEDLKESELVIFKGDLNYRKLVADAMWKPTTSFIEALGPLGNKSGLRILSLRTCKSHVIVGLQPGQDEELRKDIAGKKPGTGPDFRTWATTGNYAVIQFCDGKKSDV